MLICFPSVPERQMACILRPVNIYKYTSYTHAHDVVQCIIHKYTGKQGVFKPLAPTL